MTVESRQFKYNTIISAKQKKQQTNIKRPAKAKQFLLNKANLHSDSVMNLHFKNNFKKMFDPKEIR